MTRRMTAPPRLGGALAAVAGVWALLASFNLASATNASTQSVQDAPSPQAGLPPAGLEDLGWMAGHWQGTRDGVQSEELWLPAKGGVMLGMHRDFNPARKRAWFEFLRIEAREDGLFYVALPGGRDATDFKLAQLEEHRVMFENPDHDFPQRISYWLDAEGALCARVEGGTGESQEWRWTTPGGGAR